MSPGRIKLSTSGLQDKRFNPWAMEATVNQYRVIGSILHRRVVRNTDVTAPVMLSVEYADLFIDLDWYNFRYSNLFARIYNNTGQQHVYFFNFECTFL